MSAHEWEGRPVRLAHDRVGLIAIHDDGNQTTTDIPAGTTGTIQGWWITDDGHECVGVMHLAVDTPDGPACLPVLDGDIEEVQS